MTRGTRQAWLAALGLLWIVFVLGTYYIFHKPFQPEQAAALGGALLDVLGVALLVSVAGGLGRSLLRPHPPAPSPFIGEGEIELSESPFSPPGGDDSGVRSQIPERLALDALAGLAIIAVAVLVAGLAGLVNGALALGAALVALVLLRQPARAWWRDLIGWLRAGVRSPGGGWSVFLAIFLALMLAMALLNALAPATKWDALVYHLTGPKLYIEAGRIHGGLDNHFLGFPQLTEMLYLWLMAWRGAAAGAALVHWLFGALALTLVGGYTARRTGSARAGLFAAATLLAGESLWWEFAWPYADLTAMAYVAAGFVTLDRWRESGAGRDLLAAGLFAGCAVGAKYTAVGAVAGLGALALWTIYSHTKMNHSFPEAGSFREAPGRYARAWLRAGLVFALAALAGFAPWLLKNALLFGNPVYPFFFEAAGWDAYRQAWYTRAGTGLLSTAPLRLLLIPWDATVCSVEGGGGFQSPFGDALPLCDPASTGALGATIGPLFLALIPLLAAGWRALGAGERDFVKGAAAFILPPYALWLYGLATSTLLIQTRLLLPAFPALATLAALALESARRVAVGQVRVGIVVTGAAGVVLVLSLVSGALYTAALGAAPALTGARAPRDFLLDQLGWHYAAIEAVNRLPDGATVMFLWEPRTFYCRAGIACRPDALLDHWYHAMRVDAGDPGAIAARWRAEGVTHVLLYNAGMAQVTAPGGDPYEPGDVEAFEAFVARDLVPVWAGDGQAESEPIYTLYRWR